jgi:hypothetical protein
VLQFNVDPYRVQVVFWAFAGTAINASPAKRISLRIEPSSDER